MRIRLIGSIIAALALLAISPAMQAQISAKPGPGVATVIPDLSGNWEPHRPVPVTAETALCGIRTVCDALRGVTAPMGEKFEEPEMQPWAEEKYKAVREGKARDPNFTGCTPQGPTDLMLDNRRLYELRQFPDVVLLLFDHDHEVRRIYMDGRGHPEHPAPTWMGHSIGKYEGEVLVVDTIGISDKAWIDVQGHPHTDALRVTERFRRLDQKSLEVQTTIDDPKTYQKPWTKTVIHHLRPPDRQVWDQTECEELLRLGTHYSAESKN